MKSSILIERVKKQVEQIKKKKYPVIIQTNLSLYNDLISECSKEIFNNNWKTNSSEKNKNYTIFWMDASPSFIKLTKLLPYQYINHFPGTTYLSKKHQLIYHINKMKKKYQKEYEHIIPESYAFPIHKNDFLTEGKKNEYYIVKPKNDSQGRGIKIFLNKDEKSIEKLSSDMNDVIIQKYIDNPMLINGYKFDLRIYVFIRKLKPELEVYMYKDGLVRMCSNIYEKCKEENLKNKFIHLANFSINKKNKNHKLPLKYDFKFFNEQLKSMNFDVEKIWDGIHQIILLSIISVYKELKKSFEDSLIKCDNNYACFEVLGFDVLLDNKGNSKLLEVNVAPSFATENSEIDYRIKKGLLCDVLKLIGVNENDKKEFLLNEKKEYLERMINGKKKKIDQEELKKIKKKREEHHKMIIDKNLPDTNFLKLYPTTKNADKFGKMFL